MIQLSSAGKHFCSKTLFEGLNWVVNNGERVGLVGGNGTGKSTLLKVLAGIETLDDGSFFASKGTTTGYLPQDGMSLSGRTVMEECLSVFGHLLEIEKEMETLTHQMAETDPKSDEYQKVIERYHRIVTEFQHHDGYALEAQVGEVLGGLGFSREDAKRPAEEFSGGWQMRLALAKLLLSKPHLLLLDEPTNHLDLEARNWLEQYLQEYPYAFVVVSHDRYFLDVAVNRILEIWNRRTYFYTGNYDRYLTQKAERRTQLEAAYKNQQDRIHHLETFINRFRYQATKAKQVQSRVKELEKIERIELPDDEKTIHFSFPQPSSSGRLVAEFRNVAKSYGEKQVFQGVNFVINRGDRIALVGVNGAGKSTLIKLLADAEDVTQGEYKLGHNVQADYFAQDQYKELDQDSRILDDLGRVSPQSRETELRSLLGCFLFSGEDVFKRIGVLSGGERNRYALLRMLLHPANFLLLDEPTNHLDMRAKDVLLEALMKYTGTVVFVSHDRYFIDNLATRVFEIGDGKVEIYPGNYEDYLWRKQGREVVVVERPKPSAVSSSVPINGDRSSAVETRLAAPPTVSSGEAAELKGKRLNPIKRQQMEDRLHEIEEEIASAEAAIALNETELQRFVSAEETQRQSQELAKVKSTLQKLMSEWEELSGMLETTG